MSKFGPIPTVLLAFRTTSTGDTARLIDTERLAYWDLNRPGDEAYREAIGLSPQGSLPPGSADGPAGGCPQ